MKKSVLVILFFIMIVSTWFFEACNSGCKPASAGDQKIGTEFAK